MVLKAYRYRFYPTEEQVVYLAKTFGCCRFVYNHFLAEKQKHYKEHKKTLSYSDCSSLLSELKKKAAWLKEISSVPLQQSLRHLEAAFQKFFKKEARFPKFKKKHYEQKATFMRNAFTYEKGEFFLAKSTQPLNIRWSRTFKGEPSSATISLDSQGRYHISLLVEEVIQPLPITRTTAGIDLGLAHAITTSDGAKEKPIRFLRLQLKRLKRKQQTLSRKTKGSSNRNKAKKALGKLSGKIRDQRLDYLHKKSKTLVNKNQVICAEDLSVKNMMKNKRLARAIGDAGWGKLLQFLKYKCNWYGRIFVQIDRFFPSSKQCSCCDAIHEELNLRDRSWTCLECGMQHDRDITAAINIQKEGLRLISWSTVGHTGF